MPIIRMFMMGSRALTQIYSFWVKHLKEFKYSYNKFKFEFTFN